MSIMAFELPIMENAFALSEFEFKVFTLAMGPLQDSDHMVQIRHTGKQIAHWDI